MSTGEPSVATTMAATNWTDVHESNDLQHALWKIVAPTLFVLTMILGMLANMCVVIRVCCRGWNTAGDVLFLLLALPSMLFLMFVVPMTGYTHLVDKWRLGAIVCKLFRSAMFALSCMKAYAVVVLCAHVHSKMTNPRALCAIANRKSVCILLCLLWLVMLTLCSPVYFLTEEDQVDEFYGFCSVAHHHDAVVLTFDAVGYLVPALASVVLLIRSCTRARNDPPLATGEEVPWRCLAITVLVAFSLMWLPLHLNNILAYLIYMPSSVWYEAWRIASTAVAYFDMAASPIIYLSVAGSARSTQAVTERDVNGAEMQRLKKSGNRAWGRWLNVGIESGLTLGLRPANERLSYFVTTSLIGCAQT